ncbi:MAG TPA: 50S ribosomal protein L28 [Spirochaetia bacterium]|mgnify:FL=1|nr:50S ribosomal protein L28 [Spirochaetaceae bacterium]HPE88699.1 50S ribosomal protein L28 [Spirochaetales bacterium]HRW24100.1 50S ribosomal protein L28 [Spirochaetia bacterium]
MSRQCDICGKGTITGNTVSKSKNRVRRVWRPNIQSVKTMVGGTVLTVKVCTRCLKANKIVKYV